MAERTTTAERAQAARKQALEALDELRDAITDAVTDTPDKVHDLAWIAGQLERLADEAVNALAVVDCEHNFRVVPSALPAGTAVFKCEHCGEQKLVVLDTEGKLHEIPADFTVTTKREEQR